MYGVTSDNNELCRDVRVRANARRKPSHRHRVFRVHDSVYGEYVWETGLFKNFRSTNLAQIRAGDSPHDFLKTSVLDAYPLRIVMPTQTDDLLRTRKTLLNRVRDLSDQASWRDFFDTYWRLIYNVARKSGFNDAAAQDIVMETFAVVVRHISDYDQEKGSFKGWLLQIARNRTIDALRRKHYRQGGEYIPREQPLNTPLLEAQGTEAALNTIWDDELRSYHLEMAMAEVKKNADAHQFQLFFLYVIKGVPALQVARRLGAKLPEVYFAKYKISARLKKEIKRLERNSP